MRQIEIIETDRLLLRPLTANDFLAVHSFGSDPEVTRFTDFGPNTEEDTRRFLNDAVQCSRIEEARCWEVAVLSREDHRLLGATGIRFLAHSAAEIGYCYAASAWGRGIATEAAVALLTLGFGMLKLHRIQARCDPANIRSARVLAKLGMRREGLLRESVHIRGAWADREVYAILQGEWGPRLTPLSAV